jgi:hypothetical protein
MSDNPAQLGVRPLRAAGLHVTGPPSTSTSRQKPKFTWRGKALSTKGPPDSKTGWAHLNASLGFGRGGSHKAAHRLGALAPAVGQGSDVSVDRSAQLPYRLCWLRLNQFPESSRNNASMP